MSKSLQPHGLWTAACQASPSFTNSWGLLKLMSIESVMPSSHLILCCPLLLLHSIFPSIRVFSVGQPFASGGQSIFFKDLKNIFSSVHSLSCVRLFVTPWTAAHQASLSNTNSQSLLKLMSIESVMPSNHLILCRPLLLLPSIFPSIRIFSNESALCIMWPKFWNFSFNISPSNEHPGLISLRMD